MFEGGEPLLSNELESWIKEAKAAGVPNIIVLTNGFLLTEERLKSLYAAGTGHFHFNFPSHRPEVHEALMLMPNMYERQIEAIKRTSELSDEAAVLVCVINSLNYRHLPDYVRFVKENFPGIYYIEFNFIKVMGSVKDKHYLVPKLSDVAPYLLEALSLAKEYCIGCLLDHIPLCFIDGWEMYTYDVPHIMRGNRTYLGEKNHVKSCLDCSLAIICAGPRKDYVSIHGEDEFKPSSKDIAEIVSILEIFPQLLLNKPDSVKAEHLKNFNKNNEDSV